MKYVFFLYISVHPYFNKVRMPLTNKKNINFNTVIEGKNIIFNVL